MFLYNGNRLENILNKVDEGLGTKEDSVLRTPNILHYSTKFSRCLFAFNVYGS